MGRNGGSGVRKGSASCAKSLNYLEGEMGEGDIASEAGSKPSPIECRRLVAEPSLKRLGGPCASGDEGGPIVRKSSRR